MKCMKFKIHHLKLACLALVLVACLTALGFWQLSRAQQKTQLLEAFHERTASTPIVGKDINEHGDLRFYRATFTGRFARDETILLDNKIFHGVVGYEVYTPFYAQGLKEPILIDRGFVERGEDRKKLPNIPAIENTVDVSGMLNLPPAYFTLGEMIDTHDRRQGLLRVEYINLHELAKYLKSPLFPYVLTLTPNHPYAYKTEWQIVIMPPEKHRAYAVQWFALAFTLLLLFFVLNHRAGQKT